MHLSPQFEMDRREFAKGAAGFFGWGMFAGGFGGCRLLSGGSGSALALAFAPLRRAAADFGKISES